MKPDKFEQLVHQCFTARHMLREAFMKEFPVGMRITWLYRENYIQTGTVEYNNGAGSTESNPQMRVLNERTGKLVWVDLMMQPQRSVYSEVPQ